MTRSILYLSLMASLCIAIGCESCKHLPPKNAKRMNLPTGTPKRPQGMAALTVKPGPEPFSRDDVSQYVKTHRLPKSLGEPAQLQVDSLEFITAGEVTKRLGGASTGLKDDERVAFATLSGPMIFTGPQTKPVTFDRSYAVFDIASGNLLMLGTLQASTEKQGSPR